MAMEWKNGKLLPKRCEVCNCNIGLARADAKTCSPKCRKIASRARLAKGLSNNARTPGGKKKKKTAKR